MYVCVVQCLLLSYRYRICLWVYCITFKGNLKLKPVTKTPMHKKMTNMLIVLHVFPNVSLRFINTIFYHTIAIHR